MIAGRGHYLVSGGPFRAYGTYERVMNPGEARGCAVPHFKSV